MKKIIIGLFFIPILISCTTTQKPLYYWGNYQSSSYQYIKNGTDESYEELMKSYQDVIEKQTLTAKNTMHKKAGTRKTIPPGVCADYGYLLCKQGKKAEGIAYLKREIDLYPESTAFISQIIKNLENNE